MCRPSQKNCYRPWWINPRASDAARMSALARLQLLRIADVVAQAAAHADPWLTEAERLRLGAMRAPARRDSFIAGHWQARQLAAQQLGIAWQRITLHAHADGRPQLCVDGGDAALHVSISHSGDWLALAVAEAAVGVDIELPRSSRDWGALAKFVCSPDELAYLQQQPAELKQAAFHQLWTLKEAHGKRSGEGLQPKQAQLLTAQPTDAENADATTWLFAHGALAVCGPAASQWRVEGAAIAAMVGAPDYWRYVTSGCRASHATSA